MKVVRACSYERYRPVHVILRKGTLALPSDFTWEQQRRVGVGVGVDVGVGLCWFGGCGVVNILSYLWPDAVNRIPSLILSIP